MKKLNFIFVLVAICFLSFRCEKEKEGTNPSPEVITIKHGTSFGMCAGYCMKSIKVIPNVISFTASGRDVETRNCNKVINLEQYNALLKKINIDDFNKLPSTIGCPDCADGGAEWIEITSHGKTNKVTFEYHNEPETVKPYIEELRKIQKSFEECVQE